MTSVSRPRVRVSWWLALLEAVLVRYVKIDEDWIARAKAAASRGPVVFILRNRSLIDFLCLRGTCKRHGLPLVGFVSGLTPFVFLPWWRWLLALFRRRLPDRQRQRLVDTFRHGGSAVVFLRRPAFRDALGSRPVEVDGIRLTVEAQAEVGGTVLALPTVFLWGEHAMHRLRKGLDFFFGSQEYPRLLRSMWLLIRRRSVHGAWIAEPLDLKEIREERGVDDAGLAGVVRAGVGRRIEKIRRSRLGGLTKPSSRVKAELLASGRLMREIEEVAAQTEIPREEVIPRARDMINKLAADFKPRVLTLFSWVMAFVWRRIYTGIDVGEKEFDDFRKAVSKGPLLILPDHKSHIDYMAISQVMEDANVMMPHIAAGENLSFWPLGWLFRSSGAFFIRRKFINDRFYTAVVNGYIRRLVQEGYAIEVFIEGGRSRTGKLLRPKLGMLEMALKAAALTPGRDLGVLPTFIGYEKVIEERSYVREAEGRKKKKEGIGSLLTAPKVLFHRYGRLHVRTGEFFSVDSLIEELGVSKEDLLRGSMRRTVAQKAAMRTLKEINRITVATPSAVLATVLLTGGEATVRHSVLRERCSWMAGFLEGAGVELSRSFSKWGGAARRKGKRDGLDRIIRVFVRADRIAVVEKGDDPAYEVVPENRLLGDFYKNGIIHFSVPAALVAASVLGRPGGVSRDAVEGEMALFCRLYRWEFFLPENEGDEELFKSEVARLVTDGIGHLERFGLVGSVGGVLKPADADRLRFVRDIVLNYHEVYLSALLTLRRRVLGEVTGDSSRLARAHYDEALESRRYTRPEGKTRINFRSAFQACKDLKLNRPVSGEYPYEKGELGDRLIELLEMSTK